MKLILGLLITLFFLQSNSTAQSFGFGCLGFVGGYGGYSYQRYQPTGLNNYIETYNLIHQDSLSDPMSNFGSAKGFRVGLNFFRANIEGLIVTAKGFYQSLQETHSANMTSDIGITNSSFETQIKNWGIGVDVGTSLTSAISWKVVDAALLFNSATFTRTTNYPGAITEVGKYKTDGSVLGYSVGTGFILNLIDEYVTLEGVAAFTVIKIDELQKEDGTQLTVSENSNEIMHNFIEAGGFNAVLQLNVGIPL